MKCKRSVHELALLMRARPTSTAFNTSRTGSGEDTYE